MQSFGMADNDHIADLKSLLRSTVSDFCNRKSAWKQPFSRTIREIRDEHWRAVLFGGTVRSLLLRARGESAWPRDIDIVIKDISLDVLETRFREYLVRRTRFGGLHLQRSAIPFDIWPLSHTWALANSGVSRFDFSDLPRTTFFNIEAIAIDLWPKRGRVREIYSDDDQFFKAISNRVIDVNLEENPFPALCVVRGLIFATSLNFSLGTRFARYVANHGPKLSVEELENIQRKHYGIHKRSGEQLKEWIKLVVKKVSQHSLQPVSLPRWKQLTLLDEKAAFYPRLHLITSI
jgi:hypothetical protein